MPESSRHETIIGPMRMQLLGGLAPARFLSQYWQKKPLLVRHAIPGFAGIVQPSNLFRLAAGAKLPPALCRLRHHWYLHGWLLIGVQHG